VGPGQTGYLGVAVVRDVKGRLVVEDVSPDAPGAKAGLKAGDVITHVGDQAVNTPQAFREWLQTHTPGTAVKIGYVRNDKAGTASAMLAATSRPMTFTGKGGGFKGKGGGGGGFGALAVW